MKAVHGDKLRVSWKNFSLEEVNKKQPEDWHVWDQPDDYPTRGLPAFRAVEAARLQGDDAFDRMHFALLKGRHERRKDFTDAGDIAELAAEAGLDLERFKRDVADRSLLRRVADDFADSVKVGVFGTPTFVFENGSSFFMRIRAEEDDQAAARTFDGLYELFVKQRNVGEVKRPTPPSD